MQYNPLGNTGLMVSQICFGSLTVGPLQADLSPEKGGEALAEAIRLGVNFTDTAELYGTYPHIKAAMKQTGKYDLVISSKTYAYTKELAEKAVEQARRELDRDYIDIFMLHEQESEHTFRGHREALDYLYECKAKGIIKAVGASMHRIAAVKAATEIGLDVIHPLINLTGMGIFDGTRQDMELAVKNAREKGIGVFSMKALAGGNLHKSASDCFDYIKSLHYIDSVAIGMQDVDEVRANIRYFESNRFTCKDIITLEGKKRSLHIDYWCTGCGKCVERCRQKALVIRNNKAECIKDRCILCSYCASACPEWAIKVV